MIEQAVTALYTITVLLKGPVVIGVLLAALWSMFEAGRFLREGLERRRLSPNTRATRWLDEDRKREPGLINDDRLTHFELAASRRLSILRIGLRMGPVLGLMGTLIPMGPALMSISEGNLTVMSNDLIIAFSTTVAGLFVGALCYIFLIVRQNWYAHDLADLERITREPRREDDDA